MSSEVGKYLVKAPVRKKRPFRSNRCSYISKAMVVGEMFVLFEIDVDVLLPGEGAAEEEEGFEITLWRSSCSFGDKKLRNDAVF